MREPQVFRPGRQSGRPSGSARGLVLAAIALGILAAGCIKDHDPRNDSSRVEQAQPMVSTASIHGLTTR